MNVWQADDLYIPIIYLPLELSMSKKASCGRSTLPIRFIRRLPSF
jgi:hypothetical protein